MGHPEALQLLKMPGKLYTVSLLLETGLQPGFSKVCLGKCSVRLECYWLAFK